MLSLLLRLRVVSSLYIGSLFLVRAAGLLSTYIIVQYQHAFFCACYMHAVTLKLAGNASFGSQFEFCPGSTAAFECQTTHGSLLWETSSTAANHIFDNPAQSPKVLGIFLLHLDGILLTNGTVSAVNSTAVVSNVQPSYNGTTLKCSEDADLSMFSEAVLKVAGNNYYGCQ